MGPHYARYGQALQTRCRPMSENAILEFASDVPETPRLSSLRPRRQVQRFPEDRHDTNELGCCALMLGLVWSSLAGAVETVRVDASSGAPRLVVDGKPVRARMFFGLPGTKPLRADTAGAEISSSSYPRRTNRIRPPCTFASGKWPARWIWTTFAFRT